jgi:photosystem II stability/assembly factor-like uncharacterized protein
MRKGVFVVVLVVVFLSNCVTASICGNDVCEVGETVLNCTRDCLEPDYIEWEQMPMRNKWQKDNNKIGGEGMQMVYDIDWNEKDTDVIYLTTDTTRVWKSVDRGNTWKPVGQDIPVNGGVSIASDPNNEDVVFLAGSRHDPHHSSMSDFDGVYKSEDGGESWEGPIGHTIHFRRRHAGKVIYIDKNSFNQTQSKEIYIGSPNGMLKSEDGGSSWAHTGLEGEDIFDIEESKVSGNVLYISTNINLYKYNIDTKEFHTIGKSLNSHPWDISTGYIADDIIYVTTKDRIYKSENGGDNFFLIMDGLNSNIDYKRIISSKNDPNIIMLTPSKSGGLHPYWSENGGSTWNKAEDIKFEELLTYGYYYARPIEFDPDDDSIAVSQASGTIIKTEDNGRNWHYSGDGFTGGKTNKISFLSGERQIYCLTDYGIFITEEGGRSFENLNPPRIDGQKSCSSIDAFDETILASVGSWYRQKIILSNDLGKTWNEHMDNLEYITFIKINENNTDIVYSNRYISNNGGKNWEKIEGGYNILAVNPNNQDIVYATKNSGYRQWSIFESPDSGVSWEKLGGIAISETPSEIVADPHSEETHLLIAAGSYSIYEYINGEFHKRIPPSEPDEIGSDQGIHSVKFDPNNRNIAWAAKRGYGIHGEGIFISRDGGTTWSNVISNLGPRNNIWNIEISPLDSTIFVTGPGIWKFSLSECHERGICQEGYQDYKSKGCIHEADIKDCNGIINDNEAFDFIDLWKRGNVEMNRLVTAIRIWMD